MRGGGCGGRKGFDGFKVVRDFKVFKDPNDPNDLKKLDSDGFNRPYFAARENFSAKKSRKISLHAQKIINLRKPNRIMEKLIPQHGNYKKLISYQKSEAIYDITFNFCSRFLEKGDRTIDQMVQAARSGKQNIIEGCAASSTSSETEIKLMNVAKASLQELLADYEDYLRTRGMRQWEEGSIELLKMRELGRRRNDSAFYREFIETRSDETIANMAIVLIKQTDYLLYKQIDRLGERFLHEGGFREKMTRMRIEERSKGQ